MSFHYCILKPELNLGIVCSDVRGTTLHHPVKIFRVGRWTVSGVGLIPFVECYAGFLSEHPTLDVEASQAFCRERWREFEQALTGAQLPEHHRNIHLLVAGRDGDCPYYVAINRDETDDFSHTLRTEYEGGKNFGCNKISDAGLKLVFAELGEFVLQPWSDYREFVDELGKANERLFAQLGETDPVTPEWIMLEV